MDWGEGEWGEFEWGDVVDVETLAPERLLYSVRRGPLARALVSLFAARVASLVAVAGEVAEAFDLETAEGAQLDMLGRLLGLPRHGYADARYRTLLQIQAVIVLSSSATERAISQIVERFTGQPPTTLTEHFPLGFEVGAVVSADEAPLLASLIRRARAATYDVELAIEDGDVLYVDTVDEDELDPGTVDTDGEDEGAAAYPIAAVIPA